jgi:CDP-diacylglycerol--glycerol-3-phosphate 3-phosphatidyltransferase
VRLDLACSLGVLALVAAGGAAYGVHVTRAGSERYTRVDKAGASALLGKGVMEAGYWSLQPVGRALSALGLSANGVTLVSLGVSLAAGLALALGHFGMGAALTAVATLGDALDGIVARQTGTASDAGEVFDAAVDRYQEFFFLSGLAVYFHADPAMLVLVLLALLGSFMVSYGTAKAEALGVESPRGAMRRVERAVYLDAGVVLAPVAGAFAARAGLPSWFEHLPILLSLALVGGVGNVSAARRLFAVARAVAPRQPHPPRPGGLGAEPPSWTGPSQWGETPHLRAVPGSVPPEAGVPDDAVHDGFVP